MAAIREVFHPGQTLVARTSPFVSGWLRRTEIERQQFVRFAILFPFKVGILAGGLVGGLIFALPFAAVLLVLVLLVFRTGIDKR